jgi:HK97 family phage major capsid protein
MNIENLLKLRVNSLDFSNEKLIKETRGEMVKAMEQINGDIEELDRSGKKIDSAKAELNYEKLKNKIFEIDHRSDPSGSKNGNGSQSKSGGYQFDSSGYGSPSGKSLSENGNIRLYAPHQKLTADQEPGEVNLGSFLRAVVDKPRSAAERTMIQNSVGSSGYSMPTTIAAELIDLLRARNPVIDAGARTISIDGLDSTKFVKITSDPDAVWHTELNEEALSDPVFGAVEMKPKTVLAMTELSREVLQDAANIEEALTATFVGSLTQAILEATFSGSAANEPTGLATLVTQTDEYANAGDPDWSNFVAASRKLHDENVPTDNRAFIHAPDIWETLALATDNQGRYQDAPSFIRDVPNHVSSGVPAGVAYAGDFSNVVYGFRLNITLEQHQSLSVRKYGTIWLAAARLDIGVFRPNAFVRIEEAAPA